MGKLIQSVKYDNSITLEREDIEFLSGVYLNWCKDNKVKVSDNELELLTQGEADMDKIFACVEDEIVKNHQTLGYTEEECEKIFDFLDIELPEHLVVTLPTSWNKALLRNEYNGLDDNEVAEVLEFVDGWKKEHGSCLALSAVKKEKEEDRLDLSDYTIQTVKGNIHLKRKNIDKGKKGFLEVFDGYDVDESIAMIKRDFKGKRVGSPAGDEVTIHTAFKERGTGKIKIEVNIDEFHKKTYALQSLDWNNFYDKNEDTLRVYELNRGNKKAYVYNQYAEDDEEVFTKVAESKDIMLSKNGLVALVDKNNTEPIVYLDSKVMGNSMTVYVEASIHADKLISSTLEDEARRFYFDDAIDTTTVILQNSVPYKNMHDLNLSGKKYNAKKLSDKIDTISLKAQSQNATKSISMSMEKPSEDIVVPSKNPIRETDQVLFATVGGMGSTMHYENASLFDYDTSDKRLSEIVFGGHVVMDMRKMTFKNITKTYDLPSVGIGELEKDEKYYAKNLGAKAPLSYIIKKYEELGAEIHNNERSLWSAEVIGSKIGNKYKVFEYKRPDEWENGIQVFLDNSDMTLFDDGKRACIVDSKNEGFMFKGGKTPREFYSNIANHFPARDINEFLDLTKDIKGFKISDSVGKTSFASNSLRRAGVELDLLKKNEQKGVYYDGNAGTFYGIIKDFVHNEIGELFVKVNDSQNTDNILTLLWHEVEKCEFEDPSKRVSKRNHKRIDSDKTKPKEWTQLTLF